MDPLSRVYKQRNKNNKSTRSSRSPDSRRSRSSSISGKQINIDLVDQETNFVPYSLTGLKNNYTLTAFNEPRSSNVTELDVSNPLNENSSQIYVPSNNEEEEEDDGEDGTSSFSYSELPITQPESQEYTSGKYILGEESEGFDDSLDFPKDIPLRKSSTYDLLSLPPDTKSFERRNNIDVEGEYIPGLNYNDIMDKWQEERTGDRKHQGNKFTGSNSNSYKKNSSSYSNLFKKLYKQNKNNNNNNNSLALTKFSTWESADEDNEINSDTNNDAYGFDSAAEKSTGITIPVGSNVSLYKSNHTKVEPIPLPNLRTLMTPPSELEMKRRISYPLIFNNDNNNRTSTNNQMNSADNSQFLINKPPYSSLKLRTLPSSSALTNQLSSLRRRGSLQIPPHRVNNDQVSVSSSLTTIPKSLESIPSLNREKILEIIDMLPDDFIAQPYSQRKKMILKLLPAEEADNYKIIMSLIKKYMLSSSKSNISLANNSVPNNSYIDDNKGNMMRTNDSLNECGSINNNTGILNNDAGFQPPHHHARHNSIASQYLSTFSPSFVSPTNNKTSTTGSDVSSNLDNLASTTTVPVKSEEKGGQIFNHTMGKIIGFGAWGTIRECFDNVSGDCHAIKIVRFKNNKKMKEQVSREISNWKKLKHPFILPLLESRVENNGIMYSLTEKIDNGTLYDLVISWDSIANTKIPYTRRCRYTVDLAYEVIEAIAYMHSLNIVHGDIKLENCLLQESHKEKPKWKLYVCDFGMSHDIVNDNPNVPNAPSNIGSLPYASPELLTENQISYKSDVWAFGVMLYTMLLGKLPFKHGSEAKLKELIRSGHFDIEALHFLDRYSHYLPLKDIICGCLQVDITKRWSVSQIEHVLSKL
ncbi:hypothetical protein C6P45_000766 [Maudiozyma exigua]|uniref:Protein kinase domain-containing protein n=1 Tax=Maudiozyma exigua TaxID=34358 RepID=A0A9P6W4N2_MAUEX|nr:hypothetical protein C6P45_000766 [Kazachstania exigua]